MRTMKHVRRFHIQVVLDGGTTMETDFSQELEKDQSPAIRFYLGYSADNLQERDLTWLTVGDIGYDPAKVMAVRIAPMEDAAVDDKPAASNVRKLRSLPAAQQPAAAPQRRRRESR